MGGFYRRVGSNNEEGKEKLDLRSVSGSVLARLLDVEVNVVALGGRGGKPSPRMAAVCATHAPGSMGRTGSVRGIVK